MTAPSTPWLALLGHPVAHSRSPAMMTSVFGMLGLDAVYLACDVAPAALDRAVSGLYALGAVGANVTIPHKQAVLDHCAVLDREVAAIGAANTLVREANGFRACNTDAPAAMRALTDAGATVRGASVLILGSGGAARAVAFGAAWAGATEVSVVARNESAAADLVASVSHAATSVRVRHHAWDATAPTIFARASIVVQTTPLGMHGTTTGHDRQMADALALMPKGAVAMDLVYAPRDTSWLRHARACGLQTIDGLGMLAHQAALSLERWFGIAAPIDGLRRFLDAKQPPG